MERATTCSSSGPSSSSSSSCSVGPVTSGQFLVQLEQTSRCLRSPPVRPSNALAAPRGENLIQASSSGRVEYSKSQLHTIIRTQEDQLSNIKRCLVDSVELGQRLLLRISSLEEDITAITKRYEAEHQGLSAKIHQLEGERQYYLCRIQQERAQETTLRADMLLLQEAFQEKTREVTDLLEDCNSSSSPISCNGRPRRFSTIAEVDSVDSYISALVETIDQSTQTVSLLDSVDDKELDVPEMNSPPSRESREIGCSFPAPKYNCPSKTDSFNERPTESSSPKWKSDIVPRLNFADVFHCSTAATTSANAYPYPATSVGFQSSSSRTPSESPPITGVSMYAELAETIRHAKTALTEGEGRPDGTSAHSVTARLESSNLSSFSSADQPTGNAQVLEPRCNYGDNLINSLLQGLRGEGPSPTVVLHAPSFVPVVAVLEEILHFLQIPFSLAKLDSSYSSLQECSLVISNSVFVVSSASILEFLRASMTKFPPLDSTSSCLVTSPLPRRLAFFGLSQLEPLLRSLAIRHVLVHSPELIFLGDRPEGACPNGRVARARNFVRYKWQMLFVCLKAMKQYRLYYYEQKSNLKQTLALIKSLLPVVLKEDKKGGPGPSTASFSDFHIKVLCEYLSVIPELKHYPECKALLERYGRSFGICDTSHVSSLQILHQSSTQPKPWSYYRLGWTFYLWFLWIFYLYYSLVSMLLYPWIWLVRIVPFRRREIGPACLPPSNYDCVLDNAFFEWWNKGFLPLQ